MTFKVMVIRTISEHKTRKAASAVIAKLKSKDGDLAMVVEMPEKKGKK